MVFCCSPSYYLIGACFVGGFVPSVPYEISRFFWSDVTSPTQVPMSGNQPISKRSAGGACRLPPKREYRKLIHDHNQAVAVYRAVHQLRTISSALRHHVF